MDNRLYKLFAYLKEDFEGKGHPLCPTCDYCDDYPSHDPDCIFADLLRNPPQNPTPVSTSPATQNVRLKPVKPTKASTLHFKVDTTHTQTEAFFEALSEIADNWESRRIEQLRLFFAGITHVYVSVKAGWGVDGPGWRFLGLPGSGLRRSAH